MDQRYSRKILTIPNLLSLLRLILAGVFAVIYWNADSQTDVYRALGVLVVSGITDCVDGKIARHFGMISELGKVLDPFADKLTQATVAFCMCKHFQFMKLLLAVLVIKEIAQAVYGYRAVKLAGRNDGAKWCGKITTTYLYLMMGLLLLLPGIPELPANLMILLGVGLLLWSFISYLTTFRKMVKQAQNS